MLLFGVGWSITGMCPGPILVNIGEGKVYALAALAGATVLANLSGSPITVAKAEARKLLCASGSSRLLAGYLLRGSADKVQSTHRAGYSTLHFHFDH